MSSRVLSVLLYDEVIGHLWSDGEKSLFSFHNNYLEGSARPVLGQYFEDRLHRAARRGQGLHPWFENLLPERGGALRERYSRALGIGSGDSFGLLSALGGDLPGAVRVVAEQDEIPTIEQVIDESRSDVLATTRFSLGGIQLKFSMSGEPDRLVLGVVDGGGSQWILKIGSAGYPGLAENEHGVMSWCRAAGFDVPETRVVDVSVLPDLGALPSTPTAYLVRRYDRAQGNRLHQEDFAQVLNVSPGRKYDATDAAGVVDLAGQILGVEGAEEALRRLVLVVATGNADAHLKNWSLLYRNRMRASWAPLYDQVATIAYPSVDGNLALRIGHAKHLNEVRGEHLRFVGEKAGLRSSRVDELVSETLTRLRMAFPVAEMESSPSLTTVLREHWNRVPLLRDSAL